MREDPPFFRHVLGRGFFAMEQADREAVRRVLDCCESGSKKGRVLDHDPKSGV